MNVDHAIIAKKTTGGGGWWERKWGLGHRTHERGREIGSISDKLKEVNSPLQKLLKDNQQQKRSNIFSQKNQFFFVTQHLFKKDDV